MTISLDEISNLVSLHLGIKTVHGDDHILQDLGAQSVDIVNIVATIEEKYNIFIDESTLANIDTVANLHTLVQQLVSSQNIDHASS